MAAEDGGAANGIPEEDEAHEASRLDESVSTQSVLSCFGGILWEASMLEDSVGSAKRGDVDPGTSDEEKSGVWSADLWRGFGAQAGCLTEEIGLTTLRPPP